LRRFIANLAGKVDPWLPLVRLKHEKDFKWGAEERSALKRIEEYLSKPPVLRAPKIGKGFKLYIYRCRRMLYVEASHRKITGRNLLWHM
jgi:hypothetical protein